MHTSKSIALFLLVFVAFTCTQSKKDDTLRVLFIGNSYTYYNSTPELFKALVQEKFPEQEIETQLISGGGMTLSDHWQNESTVATIRSGDWDYVVLQEQSKLGMSVTIDNNVYFGETERFFEYARKFDTEITNAGARTAFLMTWSVKDQPEEQAILTNAYASTAKELGGIVAPVGLVWDELRTNPKIELYADDGGHPSPIGSYLSAVTLYATLMSDDPQGLSGTISGNKLSSTGERSLNKELLVDISTEDSKLIQATSWKVVEAMQESNGVLDVKQPAPSFTIPELSKGENIELTDILGKWYGTSTYGSDYLGQIMEIREKGGQPEVSLSFYSPHGKHEIAIDTVIVEVDQLIVSIYDSLRTRDATLRLTIKTGKMKGLLESFGNNKMYKHFSFSKESVNNEIDLSTLALLMESFRSNTIRDGYVKAALKYYGDFSKLIGEKYKPEDYYLNAVGYNSLQDGKVNDALNAFQLATAYYPESINAYDSYAEALIVAGRKDEALAVYKQAYTIAKKTGHKNLAYIENRLSKLTNSFAEDLGRETVSPPPPPPPLH